MAILMVYMPPMKRAGWSLLLNVAGFGVATIIFGISESFWLSFFMLFLSSELWTLLVSIFGSQADHATLKNLNSRC